MSNRDLTNKEFKPVKKQIGQSCISLEVKSVLIEDELIILKQFKKNQNIYMREKYT